MVEQQIRARGVENPRVLAAMAQVPREAFVGSEGAQHAYDDAPQPILEGQTISQPYVVACMIEAMCPSPTDQVLEIGTGSGYAAAVLSRIVDHVYTVERYASLARLAAWRLYKLGYRNVDVMTGDGSLGLEQGAPYDSILVSAGAPEVPPRVRRQLRVGGWLIIPVGRSRNAQRLMAVQRLGPDEWRQSDLGDVRFVPLIGVAGWDAPDQPACG